MVAVKIESHWEQAKFQEHESPVERSSHGISEVDGVLYVFGGEDAAKVPVDSSVYALDVLNQNLQDGSAAWRKIGPSKNSPIPRVAHAQATIGSKIYVFGGQSLGTLKVQSVLNDLYYFDAKTEEWQIRMREVQGSICVASVFQVMFGYFGNDYFLSGVKGVLLI